MYVYVFRSKHCLYAAELGTGPDLEPDVKQRDPVSHRLLPVINALFTATDIYILLHIRHIGKYAQEDQFVDCNGVSRSLQHAPSNDEQELKPMALIQMVRELDMRRIGNEVAPLTCAKIVLVNRLLIERALIE